MNNIKALAFDMDGTILKRDQTIHPDNIKAIQEASKNNVKIILASGRPFISILDTAKLLGCVDLIVANNGSCIYNMQTKEFWDLDPIPKEIFKIIKEKAIETESLFTLHTKKNAYKDSFLSKDKQRPEWAGKSKEELSQFFVTNKMEDIIESEPITQISIVNNKENIIKIRDELKEVLKDEFSLHIANTVYLDINPKNTSKLTGINKAVKIYGLSSTNVMAFGDSDNDLQMIEGCALGVAMENSTKALKEISDDIIGHHETNAISKKIKEVFSFN
ncbi:MAG: Cof-type HAD-IIB family hydrolase [Mycoplasma sp.]|nr:Cof-type HAD-IIB family hydrolase [Mycoplasma sp.]